VNELHHSLIRCARRLGSRARRGRGDESWLFSEALALSIGVKHLVAHAGMVEQKSIPIDVAVCDGMLADGLERGFVRLVFVLSSAETFKFSIEWMEQSAVLLEEAAVLFSRRGRNLLAAASCRAGAGFAFENSALALRDRLIVKAENYLTARADAVRWFARTMLRLGAAYGYSPARIFWVALLVVAVTTLLVHQTLHLAWPHALSLAVGDYFTLGGATEYAQLPTFARLALAIEALFALILNGFFITLLARRWFRA